jgi:predicted nucleic acid-binding protein
MFLDTSIIIEILRSVKKSRRFEDIFDLIEDEILFISMIQLSEISDWCLSNNIEPENRIKKIKNIVNVIPLTEEICLEGSRLKHEMRKKGISKFSLIDGLIIASARMVNQNLLTTDSDFRKITEAIIVK